MPRGSGSSAGWPRRLGRDFEKPGYAPRKAKVSLKVELARIPAIAVAMKKQ